MILLVFLTTLSLISYYPGNKSRSVDFCKNIQLTDILIDTPLPPMTELSKQIPLLLNSIHL